MANSMTGFGAADGPVAGGHLHVEIRTVNHRHFNAQLKLPHRLVELEAGVRDILRQTISRGHVTVVARWTLEPDRPVEIGVDLERADAYRRAFEALAAHLGTSVDVSLDLLARQGDILTHRQLDAEPVDLEDLQPVLEGALEAVRTARAREGEILAADLAQRVEAIRALLEQVEARAPERIGHEQARLRAAVAELTDGIQLDDARLAQEIALLADKLDVSEEAVRLRAHLDACAEAFAADEPIGKRLGFLGQEMLREINTIGSKANDATIAHAVIAMKGEIEKFREQVENIE